MPQITTTRKTLPCSPSELLCCSQVLTWLLISYLSLEKSEAGLVSWKRSRMPKAGGPGPPQTLPLESDNKIHNQFMNEKYHTGYSEFKEE